jgi:sterol desaturase/sphingolipid hydroxylase (fatty acid hydroxylase superfamily)
VNEKYIALAIPVFFVLIVLELIVSRVQGERRFELQDTITDLSCGVGEQVLLPFQKTAILAGYVFLYERFRVTTLSTTSPLVWIALLLGVDLGYYAFHRASHRVNFIWATHVVHHQSEEYNLAVALRQSWFFKLIEWWFYLPLAIVGFEPEMFLAMTTFNTLGQFWLHTRAVKRLGPLEWIFNTPSHHRVHHGINPKYIDKNYGGLLIIWDRMFGTFKKEEEEPVYGTVKPLASFNPLWANAEYWVEIAKLSRSCTTIAEKMYAWLAPPEWRPKALGGKVTIPETSRAAQVKFAVRTPRALKVYVAVQFLVIGGATAGLNAIQGTIGQAELAVITALVITNLVAWGGLFERKRWAVPLELARLVAVPGVVAWTSRGTAMFVPLTAAASAMSLAFGVWLLRASARARATTTAASGS